jgi:hypothetical protein
MGRLISNVRYMQANDAPTTFGAAAPQPSTIFAARMPYPRMTVAARLPQQQLTFRRPMPQRRRKCSSCEAHNSP